VSTRARSAFVLAGLLTLIGTAVFRLGTDVSTAAVSSTLHGSVGPGFEISLTFDDGSAVRSLPAGTYRVEVNDLAADHNFHLVGPGVDLLTSVETRSSVVWNVTFRNDVRYTFLCDPHADEMNGSFDVGAPVAAEAAPSGGGGGGGSSGGGSSGGGLKPAAGKPASKLLGTVQAGLDATGRLKLTLNGKAVKALAAGSYRFVVSDASKQNGVTLRRSGAAAKALTGVAFVGRKSVTTQLAAGQWSLSSSSRPSAGAVSFRVTRS
jgi:hypothetical protein